jgi:hypothetical protein
VAEGEDPEFKPHYPPKKKKGAHVLSTYQALEELEVALGEATSRVGVQGHEDPEHCVTVDFINTLTWPALSSSIIN